MISLTRLSGAELVINSDLIERVDRTPDTVITLTNGAKYVVAESTRAVIAEVRLHRAEVITLSELLRRAQVEDLEVDDLRRRPRSSLATVTPHPSAVADRDEKGRTS